MSHYKVAPPPFRPGEKQSRVVDGNRSVRVIDSFGRLVDVVREPQSISRYLSARNAIPILASSGRLCAIQLASLADDRGQPGERHGSSLITTERCRNGSGEYTGTPLVIKHKQDKSESR